MQGRGLAVITAHWAGSPMTLQIGSQRLANKHNAHRNNRTSDRVCLMSLKINQKKTIDNYPEPTTLWYITLQVEVG